jgi:uncharacterized membrane protein
MEIFGRIINAAVNVHPWHSIVVHFPIGLTGAALLFLVLALWQQNEALEKAAFFSITLAAVSTVVAGLTGMRDNIVRFDGAAPLVNVKIFLAITLLVLTSVTAFSRWRQQEILWKPATMVLYAAAFLGSFALTIVLGFLGGVILYGL